MALGYIETDPDRESARLTLDAYRRRLVTLLDSVDLDEVAMVADRLHEAWENRALVVVAGNGGSATTASHVATDLSLNAGASRRAGLRAVSLPDNAGVTTALANDRDYDSVFAEQIDSLVGPDDVVLLISASGNSPNVLRAAERASELGATAIALVGFGGGKLAELCDLVVHVRSDPGEYGPVEDLHLVCNHMICTVLQERTLRDAASEEPARWEDA